MLFTGFIGADVNAAGPGPTLLIRVVMGPPGDEGRVDGGGDAEVGRTEVLVEFLSVDGCKEVEKGVERWETEEKLGSCHLLFIR